MSKIALLASLGLLVGACVGAAGDLAGSAGSGASESSSSGSSSGAESAATIASTSAASANACGWGLTGQTQVPMGYICGGEGTDPGGAFPRGCPEEVDLVEGGACGGNMGITGAGCCDATGNVWLCVDEGAGPRLWREDC